MVNINHFKARAHHPPKAKSQLTAFHTRPPPCGARSPFRPRPGFSLLVGACKFSTAWAGLLLVNHRRQLAAFGE